jgi:hypothetical protein
MDDAEPVESFSVDPENLRAELVRQFETTCRYVRRQGLSEEEMAEIVRLSGEQPSHHEEPLVPLSYALVELPDLLDKGIPSRVPTS